MSKHLGINRAYGFVQLTDKDLTEWDSDFARSMPGENGQGFMAIVKYFETVFDDETLDKLNYVINAVYEIGKEDGYNSF